jgi:predicted thioesterase
MGLEEGLEASLEEVVTEVMTATAVGSGDVRVLATPVVLSLVERAAVQALRGRLPEGQTSVGASVTLDHLAPTPVGAGVTATVRLQGVEGRRLTFSFSVTDPAGEVARGTHTRVMVDRERSESGAGRRTG